jgi:uncharacterized membrane protein
VLSFVESPLAWAAAMSLALAGVVFGAYLLVVQVAVIGALCDWCLVSDGLLTVLTALVLLRAVAAPAATTASRGTSRSRA